MSLDHTYHALADASRRGMLRRLAQGRSLSVSDLAAPLAIGLPTVMKHLDVLARAGLIERHKRGVQCEALVDRPHGVRELKVEHPQGYVWGFMQRIAF